jgi:hypothetical protein
MPFKDLYDRFQPVFRGAVYATLVTLLAVIAGVLGSVYSREIGSAFPLYWGPYDSFSVHALAFWGTLVAFALLFFFRQAATDRARQQFVDLIRTLPPAGFLSEFDRILRECEEAVTAVLGEPTQTTEALERAIRVVLDGVVTLAALFDGRPYGVTYAANVMLFRETRELPETEILDLKNRLQFLEPAVDIRALDGVLNLQLSLSTTTATREPEPDLNLKPLSLPIPSSIRSADGRRSRLLPGAPLAFVTGNMELYTDTSTLGKWCRTYGDFSESVCGAVEAYFGSPTGMRIRSFASFPLAGERETGVINIHRNRPGLLGEKEPAKQFWPLMHPFRTLCLRLLKARGETTEETGRS